MKESDFILESVRERDIDLLFLEEWNVNKDYCEWFIKTMSGRVIECINPIAYHSISADNLGETDLFLKYRNNENEFVVLLENKVDAIAQDQQGLRYRKRASNLMSSGKYLLVNTCIIAPENYLNHNLEVNNYDYKVSYEQIMEWFNGFQDTRNRYRALIIKYAIEQQRRGYNAKADVQVTQFWHDYWEQLKLRIPTAYMKEPYAIPAGSDWPTIVFDWMPDKWTLRHKLAMGVIDLETKLNEEEALIIIKKCGDLELSVCRTGKSVSIRMKTKPLDRNHFLISQHDMFESAINALQKFERLGLVISARDGRGYAGKT